MSDQPWAAAGTDGATGPVAADPWADWLLRHRFGGDRQSLARMLPQLYEFRDRVLAGARIGPGDAVLDVGCGDGLLGMAVLPRVGDAGTVVFSDVSADLLARCRQLAGELGFGDRSRFVQTGLPELPAIPTGSVDVALTMSVLMYVADKPASFAALHRVLRPGGRLSIFEPINSFSASEPAGQLWGFDVTGMEAVADRVRAAYRRHLPADNPMVDFDERDLLAAAEAAGFGNIRLDLHVRIDQDTAATGWDTLLRHAPNPLVPPLGEILDEVLTPQEREQLAQRVEPQSRAGRRHRRLATAYLVAQR